MFLIITRAHYDYLKINVSIIRFKTDIRLNIKGHYLNFESLKSKLFLSVISPYIGKKTRFKGAENNIFVPDLYLIASCSALISFQLNVL